MTLYIALSLWQAGITVDTPEDITPSYCFELCGVTYDAHFKAISSSCSEMERERGDSEVWEAQDNNTVGVREGKGGRARYAFDTVFGHAATNKEASFIPHSIGSYLEMTNRLCTETLNQKI